MKKKKKKRRIRISKDICIIWDTKYDKKDVRFGRLQKRDTNFSSNLREYPITVSKYELILGDLKDKETVTLPYKLGHFRQLEMR